jgi:Ca2+-binding RTX toxin-like protein
MSRKSWFQSVLRGFGLGSARANARRMSRGRSFGLEALEGRQLLTVTVSAYYCDTGNALTVSGDGSNDTITITNSSGNLQVNGSNVPCADEAGNAQSSSVQSITVSDSGGTNTISLSGVTTAVFLSLTDVDVTGGSGADTITGSGYADSIVGGAGADSLSGGAGNDSLYGGSGDDTINGGSGNDYLEGGSSDADRYDFSGYGTNDTKTIYETSVGNIADFSGTSISVTFYMDVQFDATQTVNADGLTIDMSFAGGTNIFSTVYGSSANDNIFGTSGNDTISGLGGDDHCYGGSGNDFLSGGDGADVILGEAGNDACYGGAGNDSIYGGTGDDLVAGDGGTDLGYGGDGSDTLTTDVENAYQDGPNSP